jgi:hypothetical protein
MDRTIKNFLISAVVAVKMERIGSFTIISDESNPSIIITGMILPGISGAGLANPKVCRYCICHQKLSIYA